MDMLIRRDAHHEAIAERARRLQVLDVAEVQQIEAAVRQHGVQAYARCSPVIVVGGARIAANISRSCSGSAASSDGTIASALRFTRRYRSFFKSELECARKFGSIRTVWLR